MKFMWGPYHQEALALRTRELKRDAKRILRMGCTQYAVNLVSGDGAVDGLAANPSPFRNGEMTRLNPKWLKRLDWLVGYCGTKGARVMVYGLMGPAIRRGQIVPVKFHGRPISNGEWNRFTGIAEDAWRDFAVRIWVMCGSSIDYVDGVEPYWQHSGDPYGPLPNNYTAMMSGLWPGCFRAGVTEHHFNSPRWDWRNPPAGAIRSGKELLYPRAGELMVGDGWGESAAQPQPRNWLLDEDEWYWNRLAGLPGDGVEPDHSISRAKVRRLDEEKRAGKQVARYFGGCAEAVKSANAAGLLVLQTHRWHARTYAEALDSGAHMRAPGSSDALVGPYKDIYRQIGRVFA